MSGCRISLYFLSTVIFSLLLLRKPILRFFVRSFTRFCSLVVSINELMLLFYSVSEFEEDVAEEVEEIGSCFSSFKVTLDYAHASRNIIRIKMKLECTY